MSLVEELGAQIHSAAEELPIGSVTVAVERLRVGIELLQWVRQTSAHEVGVAHLALATEQLEQASLALRVAQDSVAQYLTSIGLGYDAAPTTDHTWRKGLAPPEPVPPAEAGEVDKSPLRRWWTERVDELAEPPQDGDPKAPARPRPADGRPGERDREAAQDAPELLRRIAQPVAEGNREALRDELRRVPPPVGLGLSAVSPPVARHLAQEVLGHEPTAADFDRLTELTRGRVRELLPGVPEDVLPAMLARLCRMPPPKPARPADPPPADAGGRSGGGGPRPPAPRVSEGTGPDGKPEPPPTHPTDPAVTGAVVVGVLLRQLGRDPETLKAGADA
jgi:hypothetical protein